MTDYSKPSQVSTAFSKLSQIGTAFSKIPLVGTIFGIKNLTTDVLLLQNGDKLLLQTGDKLQLLEGIKKSVNYAGIAINSTSYSKP